MADRSFGRLDCVRIVSSLHPCADPVCLMLNAIAMMGLLCGRGSLGKWCLLVCSGTVCVVNHVGGEKGPLIRPACTSAAISSAMSSQLSSTCGCWSFLRMYSLLNVCRSSIE